MLGPDYDVDTHFTPSYRPWRQRIAFVPDADLFQAIKDGKASVVTDEIDRFTEKGILLKSGEVLEADIIVTATGFNLCILGDIAFEIDGKPLDFADTVTYRGMMFTGVPNMAWVFGYFRASWTLRTDLVADFVCRMLAHMKEKGVRRVVPTLRKQDDNMPRLPWIDPENFNPGYMMRAHASVAQARRQAGMAAHPGLLGREGRNPGDRSRRFRVRIRLSRLDQGRVQQIAVGPRRDRIERPAGGEHELVAAAERIDAGLIEAHDRMRVGAIAKDLAVAPRHVDLVADPDVLQETEMRIAMRGIDRDAALAGIGGEFDMAGTEGQRLAAGARQHDGAGADPLHLDPRHRPGVGPRPRLGVAPGRDGLGERAIQQHLRQQRLGVDVGALPEQDQAGEGEKERESGCASHWPVIRVKLARAALGGGGRARSAGAGWGNLLLSSASEGDVLTAGDQEQHQAR